MNVYSEHLFVPVNEGVIDKAKDVAGLPFKYLGKLGGWITKKHDEGYEESYGKDKLDKRRLGTYR